MATAIERLHGIEGVSFEGIVTGGRLDPLIWMDLFKAYGLAPSELAHDTFRTAYGEELGASGLLIKPYGKDELVEMLESFGRI